MYRFFSETMEKKTMHLIPRSLKSHEVQLDLSNLMVKQL